MNKTKTRTYIFIALYIALSVIFNYISQLIPFLQMPNGGSIDLSVIVLFVASYHLGYKWGISVGILSWIVQTMIGMPIYIVTPMQVLLDYIMPMTLLGMASFLPTVKMFKKSFSNIFTGVIFMMILKYISQVLSGVYYWSGDAAAGSAEAWLFSISYNLWYNVATLLLALIITPLIIQKLSALNNIEFKGIKN